MLHPFSRRHFLKGTALALGAFALNGFYGTAHAVPGGSSLSGDMDGWLDRIGMKV